MNQISTKSITLNIEIENNLENILFLNNAINKSNNDLLRVVSSVISISSIFDVEFNIGKKYIFSKIDYEKIIQCMDALEHSEYTDFTNKIVEYLYESNLLVTHDVNKNTSDFELFSKLTAVTVNVEDYLSEEVMDKIIGEYYSDSVKRFFSELDLCDVMFKYDPITLSDINKDLVLGNIDINKYRQLILINSKNKILKYLYDFKRLKEIENEENPQESEADQTNPNDKNKQFTKDTTHMGSGLVKDFNPGHVEDATTLSADDKIKFKLHRDQQKELIKNPEYRNKYLNKDAKRRIIK